MIFLCVIGFITSKQIRINPHVLATPITCRPLPFPSLAPSMIPGRSNNWIFAPLYLKTPGTQVSVVNS